MKIKTIVCWVLWVGNDLTLQTVGGQNSDLAWPPSFPRPFDVDDERAVYVDGIRGRTSHDIESHSIGQVAGGFAIRVRPPMGLPCDLNYNGVDGIQDDFAIEHTRTNFAF